MFLGSRSAFLAILAAYFLGFATKSWSRSRGRNTPNFRCDFDQFSGLHTVGFHVVVS